MTEHDIERQLKELSDQVSNLAGEVKSMQNGQYVTHGDLAAYLTIAAFEERMDKLTRDMVETVTKQTTAIVRDAFDSSWREVFALEFREMFRGESDAVRAERRAEIKEDVQAAFGKAKLVVLYLIPFLTVVNVVGQWLNWW